MISKLNAHCNLKLGIGTMSPLVFLQYQRAWHVVVGLSEGARGDSAHPGMAS